MPTGGVLTGERELSNVGVGCQHFAHGLRVIRVVADLGGEVEGDREAHRSLREEIKVSLVRFARGPETRILPHGPKAGTVSTRMDSPGEGEGAWRRNVVRWGARGRRSGEAGRREEVRLTVLIFCRWHVVSFERPGR